MRILALAKLLYENFEMAFSREWDDLPEHCRTHWLAVARELDSSFKRIYAKELSHDT